MTMEIDALYAGLPMRNSLDPCTSCSEWKEQAEQIRVLREALRPWVDSEGGRLWVWPETALQSALQNSRAALEATK